MAKELITRQLDAHRRLVMPASCPPGAAVTVQQIDSGTYLVRVCKPETAHKVVLIPSIDKLPDDPDWEAQEASAAKALSAQLPRPTW